MKTILLSTAIILGIVAQAQANDQLARSLGMEPGQYTSAELVQLSAAQADNNTALFNHLLEEFNGTAAVSAQNGGITDGHRQLAASLGVNATDFTMSELVQLRAAREDGDSSAERYIMSNSGTATPSRSGGVTAGHRQVAASLGVDPEDYTMEELTGMFIGAHD